MPLRSETDCGQRYWLGSEGARWKFDGKAVFPEAVKTIRSFQALGEPGDVQVVVAADRA